MSFQLAISSHKVTNYLLLEGGVFDFWEKVETSRLDDVFRRQTNATGEKFDITRTTVLVTDYCPYEGYQWVKFVFRPQTVKTLSGEGYIISAPKISFALVSTHERNDELDFIRLERNSGSVARVNRILSLRINENNLKQFVVFFGVMISDPGFYFLTSLNHIQSVVEGLREETAKTLRHGLSLRFGTSTDEELLFRVTRMTTPLIGTCFTLKVPVIYRGMLAESVIRVSDHGFVQMEDEEFTQIKGLYDPEEGIGYYSFDLSPALMDKIVSAHNQEFRAMSWLDWVVRSFRTFSTATLPFAALYIAIIVVFGPNEPVVVDFLRLLSNSHFFSWTFILVGAAGLLLLLVRTIAIEVIQVVHQRKPIRWNKIVTDEQERIVAGHESLTMRGVGGFLSIAQLAVFMLFLFSALAAGLTLPLIGTGYGLNDGFLLTLSTLPWVGTQLDLGNDLPAFGTWWNLVVYFSVAVIGLRVATDILRVVFRLN